MTVTRLRQLAVLASLTIPALAFAAPPETKKIEVVAHKYAFEPSHIEVKVGEPVEITFRSTDTKHGFVSKDLGLEKVVFSKDQPATVKFTPSKAGTFAFKCARFCGMGHGKMKGEIVVTP
jgi:cytochrome c oxidase subunit II